MNILERFKKPKTESTNQSALAEIALNSIHDGVIMTDKKGVIQFINPAASKMTNSSAHHSIGLDYGLVIKLESKEGRELTDRENPLVQAMTTGQPLEPTQVSLIMNQSGQRLPIAISVQISNDPSSSRIITFRDIAKELAEEGEQTEFISTASHEMRTPVATIDGYLSLALNPQTASIDERARGYLTAAEKASKHLGNLFQNLLDITRLDDGHIRPHFAPVEMIGLVEAISDDFAERAKQAKLTYSFGSSEPVTFGGDRRMSQVVYGYVDPDFMREIMSNLIENAIKYTPEGGSIYVNVRGDGDRVLINVTDTGMGISAEDLAHIFQKFYRVDNSDTRTIGGTGLGLYLVKQRAEAMGGKVWAESAFGEGSTFYVSLPRITSDEYEKRMIAVRNQQMVAGATQPAQPVQPVQPAQVAQPVQPAQVVQPVQPVQPAQPAPQPAPVQPPVQPIPQPVAQPAPQPVSAQPTPRPAPQPTPQPVQPHPQPVSQPAPQPVIPQPQPRPQPAPTPPPAPIPPPTPNLISPARTSTNNNLNGEPK